MRSVEDEELQELLQEIQASGDIFTGEMQAVDFLPESADEPPSPLSLYLGRISNDGLVAGDLVDDPALAELAALDLMADPSALYPHAIRGLTDEDQLGALAASVQLRTERILIFWKPLLPMCRQAETNAPIPDLVGTASLALAVSDAYGAIPAGARHDASLYMKEIARQLQAWIPDKAARTRARVDAEAREVARSTPGAAVPLPPVRAMQLAGAESAASTRQRALLKALLVVVGGALLYLLYAVVLPSPP